MDDVTKRVANLSPAKRALLKLKLKKQNTTTSSAYQSLIDTTDEQVTLAQRVANLSPVKRALLAMKFGQKSGAFPDTSTYQSATDTTGQQVTPAQRVANLSPAKRALFELKLKQQHNISPQYPTSPSIEHTTEPVTISQQIARLSPAKRALLELRLKKEHVDISKTTTERPPVIISEAKVAYQTDAVELDETESKAQSETLDWLADTEFATIDIPDWLMDSPQPDAPAKIIEPEESPEITQSATAANTSDSIETLIDEMIGDNKTPEATGMLAGLSTLLPAEKVLIPSPEQGDRPDDLIKAAQEFYAIATQTPQPITLPAPLTRREKMMGQILKGILYLLFMGLIALPFLDTKEIPRTEPTGASNDILDNQRRQLISQQLGIIDVQQPDAIALVSFDYSTATQGEMKPLAKAVLGRLKGQGMRIMTMSLEPEGAIIAQQTLDELLKDRDEAYGINTVNLGYRPGQATAIRELVTTQKIFATIPDFKEGKTLDALNQTTWNNVNNLAHVDIIVTLADNPTTARWWIEQLEMAPQPTDTQQFLLAATSANAAPFLQPYRDSAQLNGLISGINGAAAIEAGRNTVGPARQMIDSQSIAHLIIVILIAFGTIVGLMPQSPNIASSNQNNQQPVSTTNSKKKT